MRAEDKLLGLLGLAKKAGKLVSAEFATEKAIREERAQLVILAGDASENTKKHFSDMCAYRDIPLVSFADKASLGRILGKELRASMALTDEKMAASFLERLMEIRS